jgi:hypothetical protein
MALLSGVAYCLQDSADVDLGIWCETIAGFGPLSCLFLTGLLLVAYFQTGRRHPWALLMGTAAGVITFGLCFFQVRR